MRRLRKEYNNHSSQEELNKYILKIYKTIKLISIIL